MSAAALLSIPREFPDSDLPRNGILRFARRLLEPPANDAPIGLRIDVIFQPDELEAELDGYYRRMKVPGDVLHGLAAIDIGHPGFVFRYRVSDGEHYIYVEDPVRACLAGYTVFNRLVEVNRRADRHLRSPHSKYARAYQRRGIASAVYRWWLAAGSCLISGARQSDGAHALWCALANRHRLVYVEVRAKQLRLLGPTLENRCREDLHTRMVLLGAGWDLPLLAARLDMRG